MSRYTDFQLKAPTEAAALAAAVAALPHGLTLVREKIDTPGEYEWIKASMNHAFDPIGPRVIVPGVYDEQGTEIEAPVLDTDFHANLRVKTAIAGDVQAVLDLVGPGHGVVTTAETGRVWA